MTGSTWHWGSTMASSAYVTRWVWIQLIVNFISKGFMGIIVIGIFDFVQLRNPADDKIRRWNSSYTHVELNLFHEAYSIFIFYDFSALRWCRWLKSTLLGYKDLFILCSQYHGCQWLLLSPGHQQQWYWPGPWIFRFQHQKGLRTSPIDLGMDLYRNH